VLLWTQYLCMDASAQTEKGRLFCFVAYALGWTGGHLPPFLHVSTDKTLSVVMVARHRWHVVYVNASTSTTLDGI
jgi:hypothetical protein